MDSSSKVSPCYLCRENNEAEIEDIWISKTTKQEHKNPKESTKLFLLL
jgi:hypothetical protein